jgi:hypothetical protein
VRKLGFVLGTVLVAGCSVLPNLGSIGGDMVRGKVSATGSQNIMVAIVRGTGADLSGGEFVHLDSLGYFTYFIPQNVDALTIVAFDDRNGNGRYDDGEPTSQETSSGSSYLHLTRVDDSWTVVEETSSGAHSRDSLTSADLTLKG